MTRTLPTAKELWDLYVNEELEELHESIDQDDYDCNYWAVYKLPDGRLVSINYTKDGQGNNNSWRDGYTEDPIEVEAYEVTTTAYRTK
jgi:hypothetical protein